jgi:putative SOS response-associated peptidase YedK
MMSWREVHAYSDFLRADDASDTEEFVTPMRFAQVIRLNGEGQRETLPMRWGFMDRRAKTPIERPQHMHARAETIDTLPTFRDAFAHGRGIVVVRTFNVGEEVSRTRTIQHTITPNDGKPLGLAVIWEEWTHRTEGRIFTFCMVTTPANALIRRVTDRMPAIIRPEDWSVWLGEIRAPLEQVKALLAPYEGDWRMKEAARKPKASTKNDAQANLF